MASLRRSTDSCARTIRTLQYLAADLGTMITVLTTPGTLWLVSDGGAMPKTDLGSYGFVAASHEGILIDGSGQVPSGTSDMNSFRAETCGTWALMWTIHQFCTTYSVKLHPRLVIKYYCDSESVLTRFRRTMTDFRRFNPNARLRADYDLEAATAPHLTFINPTFHWVASHQDKNTAVADLAWEGQLNVHCDKLATIQLAKARAGFTIPIMNTTGAEFRLSGLPVTANIPKQTRDRAGFPALQKYLRGKNGWSALCWTTIDWTAHSAALSTIRAPGRLTRMHKFLASKLPVGAVTKHYNPDNDGKCPSCHDIRTEPENHVFRCSAPDRQTHRREVFATFEIALRKIRTSPPLHNFILHALHRWVLTGRNDFQTTTKAFRALTISQAAIGWDQMFRGRITTRFALIQEAYHRQQDHDIQKATGAIWSKRFILLLWDAFESIWAFRNLQLHPDDPVGSAALRLKNLQTRVNTAYESVPALSPADLQYFPIDQAAFLQSHHLTLTNWLSQVEPLLPVLVQPPARPRNQTTISQFFPPPQHPPRHSHGQRSCTAPPQAATLPPYNPP